MKTEVCRIAGKYGRMVICVVRLASVGNMCCTCLDEHGMYAEKGVIEIVSALENWQTVYF